MTRNELEKMFADALRKRVDRLVENAVAERERKAELADLQKRLDVLEQLEKEPDPAQAPFRGTAMVGNTPPDVGRPSALKAAQERDEAEQIAYLEKMAAQHPNAEMRERAAETLARKGAS